MWSVVPARAPGQGVLETVLRGAPRAVLPKAQALARKARPERRLEAAAPADPGRRLFACRILRHECFPAR